MSREENNNRRPGGRMRRSRKKVCAFCAGSAGVKKMYRNVMAKRGMSYE